MTRIRSFTKQNKDEFLVYVKNYCSTASLSDSDRNNDFRWLSCTKPQLRHGLLLVAKECCWCVASEATGKPSEFSKVPLEGGLTLLSCLCVCYVILLGWSCSTGVTTHTAGPSNCIRLSLYNLMQHRPSLMELLMLSCRLHNVRCQGGLTDRVAVTRS